MLSFRKEIKILNTNWASNIPSFGTNTYLQLPNSKYQHLLHTCFCYAQKGLGADGIWRLSNYLIFKLQKWNSNVYGNYLTFWAVLSHNSYCLACILQSCCCLFMSGCLQVDSIYLQIIQKILFIKINVCVYYYHHKYRLISKKELIWYKQVSVSCEISLFPYYELVNVSEN